MQKVQTGTLEDPHLGATLLVECDSLQEGDELDLTTVPAYRTHIRLLLR
ncbi:MAG: hypothetical protein ACLTDX_17460 [[Clostridium] innocuum]